MDTTERLFEGKRSRKEWLGAGSKKSCGSQHSEISLFEVAPVDKERSNHVTNNRLTFR